MTSAISIFSNSAADAFQPQMRAESRRAFTLIELLVVIGIILLLAGILLPLIGRSYRAADKARVAADLQSISVALEAYKSDFGDYPRPDPAGTTIFTTSTFRGAMILCRALLAPEAAVANSTTCFFPDGADGPGFRIRAQGKVYGPYLDPDKFKVVGASTSATVDTYHIVDHTGSPILYFPAARTTPVIATAGNYVANSQTNTTSLYNFFDDSISADPVTSAALFGGITYFEAMIGDTNGDGAIILPEKAVVQPYLLWAAGPDGKFGPVPANPPTITNSDITACDDVTNIRR